MATEEAMNITLESAQDTAMHPDPTDPTPADSYTGADEEETAAPATKKRPRIDMAVEPRERKRGKTMFGLVLGTLKKAKNEDKERNASDAAKKRQLIEQRLQDKIRKETDSVRRADEAKRAKTTSNRKEEELQLKDSIHKLRRTRLPLLSNFLLTSDVIPSTDSDAPASTNPLSAPHHTRPPPLYYLPAKLVPSQEVFLQRRKAEVAEAAEKEWDAFKIERTAGIEEINSLRQRVAEEEALKKAPRQADEDERGDANMAVDSEEKATEEATMVVDDSSEKKDDGAVTEGGKDEDGGEKKMEATSTPGYDDDAVEY